MAVSKHLLYELSVQSPKWQVDYLPQFHKWLTGRTAMTFREDFCGTAKIACEWVKSSPRRKALGLDLDREVLEYAGGVNRPALAPKVQKRLSLRRADVRTPTREKFDWIGAFNYSVFEFHERRELIRYFRAAHASLNTKGTLFLEIAGGDAFLAPSIEERRIKVPGAGMVTQAWEQQQYDPITGRNDYSIHFKLPRGKTMSDAFVYHWRVWSIPEIRDALAAAGFKKSVVLWEQEDGKGKPTGEYLPAENAGHPDFYVAYVVGVKAPN